VKTRLCPGCDVWAAEFDPYFRRWRCFSCGWMPRSSVEAWREMRSNPRRGGSFPPGTVLSGEGLSVGGEYEFMAEADRGRWVRLAVRTFAGRAKVLPESDEAVISDVAAGTGARREFTCHARSACGPTIQFWDGGARDGHLESEHLLGDGATFAIVPVSAESAARRRTDDNLREVFG